MDSTDINLLEYWHVIKRRKMFIVITVSIVTVATIIVSLVMTKIYRAETVIMPLSGGGLSALATKFSDVPFISGMVGNESTSARQTMALLETRSIAEKVIGKLNLMKVLYSDDWDEKIQTWKDPESVPNMEMAVNKLKTHMNFFYDKKAGTIMITAVSGDPQLAADMSNAYTVALQEFINENSLTVSKRNRIFVEAQLAKNKRDLLEVGKEINEFYRDGRVSNVGSRVDVVLGVDNEYNFKSEESFTAAGYESPVPILGIIEDQKTRLNEKLKEIDVVKDVPQQVYLQYLTLRGELLGKINALLSQQYEMAKINEAKEDLSFQVIDPAHKPYMRFSPQRRKMVQMAFLISLICSVFAVFILDYMKKLKEQHAKGIKPLDR